MDELTLLRSTRDDGLAPSHDAREDARARLLERAADLRVARTVCLPRHARRPVIARVSWALAGVAVAATGIVVAGNIGAATPPASAAQVMLRHAAAQTIKYTDPVPGPGQYLHLRQFSRWQSCSGGPIDQMEGDQLVHKDTPFVCEPYDDTRDLYIPADRSGEWVWQMTKTASAAAKLPAVNVTRKVGGGKTDEDDLQHMVQIPADIPTDGDAAYKWIDAQYRGASSNRDEDNFVRITDILRSGLVPAAPRAALLEALAKVPGVTMTDGVANLDGVKGVAIGRAEATRGGQRHEIIIDPDTGLVLGERTLAGTLPGDQPWGPDGETGLTAFELTVVDSAP